MLLPVMTPRIADTPSFIITNDVRAALSSKPPHCRAHVKALNFEAAEGAQRRLLVDLTQLQRAIDCTSAEDTRRQRSKWLPRHRSGAKCNCERQASSLCIRIHVKTCTNPLMHGSSVLCGSCGPDNMQGTHVEAPNQ